MNKKAFSIMDVMKSMLFVFFVIAIMVALVYPLTSNGVNINPFVKDAQADSVKHSMLSGELTGNSTVSCSGLDFINPFDADCRFWST